MDNSVFDPNQFLDATTTEALERREPLPVGDYQAEIADVEIKPWVGKQDPTKSGIAAYLKVKVNVKSNPDASKLTYDELTMRDSIMIDQTPDGSIDYSKGKNSQLRIYREALDMNKPGQPFSFRMMLGRILKVRVKHEVYQNQIQDRIDAPIKA